MRKKRLVVVRLWFLADVAGDLALPTRFLTMEHATHFVLQNIISPIVLMCFLMVVLFQLGGMDGVPILKALISAGVDLAKVTLNLLVKLACWLWDNVLPGVLSVCARLLCPLAEKIVCRCGGSVLKTVRRR